LGGLGEKNVSLVLFGDTGPQRGYPTQDKKMHIGPGLALFLSRKGHIGRSGTREEAHPEGVPIIVF
jgi:hypothetical protein